MMIEKSSQGDVPKTGHCLYILDEIIIIRSISASSFATVLDKNKVQLFRSTDSGNLLPYSGI